MSWVVGTTEPSKASELSLELPAEQGADDERTVEQFEQAKSAALALVKSGAVGDPEGEYFVSLSGHAHSEEAPVESITINVAGAAQRPPEAA